MERKRKVTSITPETHPDGWAGYPFLSVIITNDGKLNMTIVDNQDGAYVRAYILDLCSSEFVSEQLIVNAACMWWDHHDTEPFSIFLSKHHLASEYATIHRLIPIDTIARIVGPCPKFTLNTKPKIRRRKKRNIAETIIEE